MITWFSSRRAVIKGITPVDTGQPKVQVAFDPNIVLRMMNTIEVTKV